MFCPYLFLVISATDFECGKRSPIENQKTKAAYLINIIKSLKPLLLPPISWVKFIGRCFKLFLNRINILKKEVPTFVKKPLRLVPPYLWTISLQPRTKLQKCGVVYKFQCWLCSESYYGECVRHLAVRSGEHIAISPLTNKRIQPRNHSAVWHHLLDCDYSPTFEDFSVLYHKNKKYVLELKESQLLTRNRPSMNRNVRPAPLYLFGWVLVTLVVALCGRSVISFFYLYT